MAAAVFLAVAAGLPLGLFMGRNKTWDAYLAPAVYLTYPVPKIVLLPIILLLLGLGDASKVAIIALILFLSDPGHCPGRGQGDRRGVFPRRPVAERPGMSCPAPRCPARHGGRAADRPAD